MRTAEQKHKAKMALDDIRQKMAEKAAGTIGPKRSRDEVDEEVPAGKRQKVNRIRSKAT